MGAEHRQDLSPSLSPFNLSNFNPTNAPETKHRVTNDEANSHNGDGRINQPK